MRRRPVIRQAIPGGKFQYLDVGCEEAEGAGQHGHAGAVAADDRDADRGRGRLRGNGAGEIAEDKTFGAVGNAGQK